MKRARIATLHAAAKNRPAGYLQECLKRGRLSPDKQWVVWTDDVHDALRAKHNPALHALHAPRRPCGQNKHPCGPSAP